MTQRVRISSKKTEKITLSDGSFVLIKGSLDYDSFNVFMQAITKEELEEATNSKKKTAKDKVKEMSIEEEMRLSLDFLKEIIVGWNFIDGDDQEIPFDAELINNFDIATISEILHPAIEIYKAEKKRLLSSEQTSSTDKSEEVPA